VFSRDGVQSVLEHQTQLFDATTSGATVLLELLDGRDDRRHGERMAVVGTPGHYLRTRNRLHDLALAAEGGDGKASPQCLA